jgi:hypothetical protein
MGIVPSRQLDYIDIIPEVDEVYGYYIEAINDCDAGIYNNYCIALVLIIFN